MRVRPSFLPFLLPVLLVGCGGKSTDPAGGTPATTPFAGGFGQQGGPFQGFGQREGPPGGFGQQGGQPGGDIPAPPAGGPVSFKQHVAPILVQMCARCHITASRGELSMATFTALMKGSENGAIVVPGKPAESRLVEVLEKGEMPPRSGGIPARHTQTIKTWVAEGAKYDGEDQNANLTTLVPGGGRGPGSRGPGEGGGGRPGG